MFIEMRILRNSTPAGVEYFLFTINFYKHLMPQASFSISKTPNSIITMPKNVYLTTRFWALFLAITIITSNEFGCYFNLKYISRLSQT